MRSEAILLAETDSRTLDVLPAAIVRQGDCDFGLAGDAPRKARKSSCAKKPDRILCSSSIGMYGLRATFGGVCW